MLIVHTSDLHLKVDQPWSWTALYKIIALCREKSADVLVIAGDVIDQAVSFYEIEGKLRGVLSDVEFPVIIIPGNHDPAALYSDDTFLGSNVKILKNPGEKTEIADICFWALPHSDDLAEGGSYRISEVLEEVEEAVEKLNTSLHILVYHGDFNSSGADEDEEGERYLNLDPAVLEASPFDLILAGHLHKKPHRFSFKGERSLILYPGSPWPVTRGVLNERYVNLVKIANTSYSHEFVPLDVPFYVREKLILMPDLSLKKQVEKFLETLPSRSTPARVILEVKGLFSPDSEFQNLNSLNSYFEELKNSEKIFDVDLSGIVDLTRIEKDPLFAKLQNEIFNAFSDDENRIKALQYMAQIFSMTVETSRSR